MISSTLSWRPSRLSLLQLGPPVLLLLAAPAFLAAQEESPITAPVADVQTTDVRAVLADDLAAIFGGTRPPASVDDLRRMEQRQKEIAARVIPCTVGIRVGAAQGSGVLISDDGYVLTAAHVAQVPDKPARIILHDGRSVRGVTLGMNRKIDAGLVKIEDPPQDGKPWPFVEMGKSDQLRPGQWCVTTGHPGGYMRGRDPVFRVGRVLACESTVIVTDCPLIGGDSGGPLFDFEGRVIGIHSRIGPPLTANMHVPVNAYSKDWELLAGGDITGDVPRGNPYIGVQSDDAEGGGAKLFNVRQGKPAYEAGLRDGDIVQKYNNLVVEDAQDLVKRVAASRVGQTVNLVILRGGETQTIELKIGAK